MSAGPRSVLLAGGGTAGHVSPLLSLADCLRRRDPDVAVLVLGTAEGLEARLVPERGYPLAIVPKVPLPRRPSADLLRLPGNLRAAVTAAGTAIDQSGAEVVVGFGGYVSTPAYLAARRRRIPVVVHEQNARPGLANRLGARIAAAVAVTFPDTALPHAHVIGMPLRHEIATLDRAALRAEARAGFGLDADRPTVLVTGGSLGAARLNAAFYGAVDRAPRGRDPGAARLGTRQGEPVESVPGAAPYVVLPYADRMDLAYAAADLVVARAGANTVCELTAVGLPAVYVPLPIGNGEQRLNARAVVEAGGGVLVDDADMTARWVADRLVGLASDPGPGRRDGRRGGVGGGAGRRRAARRPRRRGRSRGALSVDGVNPRFDFGAPAARARRPRSRPPRRHRRGGHVGRRRHHARPRRHRHRLRRQGLRGAGGACAPGALASSSDTTHPTSTASTRSSSPRPSGTTTSSWPPAAPGACGSCTGPRRSP